MTVTREETVSQFAAELDKHTADGDPVRAAIVGQAHRYERMFIGGIEILANGGIQFDAILELTGRIGDVLQRRGLKDHVKISIQIDLRSDR